MTENELRYRMALQYLAGYIETKRVGSEWTEGNRTDVLREINSAISERVPA